MESFSMNIRISSWPFQKMSHFKGVWKKWAFDRWSILQNSLKVDMLVETLVSTSLEMKPRIVTMKYWNISVAIHENQPQTIWDVIPSTPHKLCEDQEMMHLKVLGKSKVLYKHVLPLLLVIWKSFYHEDYYAGDTDFLLNYETTYARKLWPRFFEQDPFVLCTRKIIWPQKWVGLKDWYFSHWKLKVH